MQVQDRSTVQSLEGKGSQVIDAIKQVIHEGNIRKISIKQDGVGAAMAPALAAIGAIAALVTECTIEVERIEPSV